MPSHQAWWMLVTKELKGIDVRESGGGEGVCSRD